MLADRYGTQLIVEHNSTIHFLSMLNTISHLRALLFNQINKLKGIVAMKLLQCYCIITWWSIRFSVVFLNWSPLSKIIKNYNSNIN